MDMMNDINLMTPSESSSLAPADTKLNISPQSCENLILFSHELPSGDIPELMRKLHKYAMLPDYPHLARFLWDSALVLRAEVQKLPKRLRDSLPPFHDIITLVSHWDGLKNTFLGGAWDGAFLCIYEIATMLG